LSDAVAFSLLIDESASMKGDGKYKLAIKAALLLGEALDSIGAPLEIIGYTTEEYEARAAMRLGLTPAYQYRTTRCSPLEHRIYKRFDETYSSTRVRLTGIEPRHNNWDEESLMFAFQRLKARPERKKIIVVICDGQPNGDANHLIETARWIESQDCKLVGVGIGADFVRQIYRNAVVVADFRRLAEELLGILAREFRPSAV
jgi:cobaltochelatase CobT